MTERCSIQSVICSRLEHWTELELNFDESITRKFIKTKTQTIQHSTSFGLTPPLAQFLYLHNHFLQKFSDFFWKSFETWCVDPRGKWRKEEKMIILLAQVDLPSRIYWQEEKWSEYGCFLNSNNIKELGVSKSPGWEEEGKFVHKKEWQFVIFLNLFGSALRNYGCALRSSSYCVCTLIKQVGVYTHTQAFFVQWNEKGSL